jgi:hypothetical protein
MTKHSKLACDRSGMTGERHIRASITAKELVHESPRSDVVFIVRLATVGSPKQILLAESRFKSPLREGTMDDRSTAPAITSVLSVILAQEFLDDGLERSIVWELQASVRQVSSLQASI